MANKPISHPTFADQPLSHDVLVSAAAQIVSAYIMNRPERDVNLSALTAEVYQSLLQQSLLAEQNLKPGVQTKPAQVNVEESVKPDYLICLEDGKRVKMLKRYLKTNFGMTPEEYKNRWNLPESYPMVAPNYAKVRSQLAKKIGLGKRGMPMAARQLQQSREGAIAA